MAITITKAILIFYFICVVQPDKKQILNELDLCFIAGIQTCCRKWGYYKH